MKVLLVEDSPRLQRSIAHGLRSAGFAVDVAGDGNEGLWYATENDYDVIVLDWMLPGLDGLGVLRELRARGKRAHVLMLSAKSLVGDRVLALDHGADDYLSKPFSFEELCARVRALVRRVYGTKSPLLQVGRLALDMAARQASVSGHPLELTPRELGVLELLLSRQQAVVARQEILDHLYEFNDEVSSNMVEVLIYTLRRKLRQAGAGNPIHTRRGQGYLLVDLP
ncbi:MAG: response regulator transcription factor [Acidobacteriota bacterium]